MRDDVLLALTHAGYDEVRVDLVLAPAWTTDWMSDAGKEKLRRYGIQAPTGHAAARGSAARAAAARGEVPALRLARTPASSPASARPRARRSTSAGTASSRSTTSRCSDGGAQPRVDQRPAPLRPTGTRVRMPRSPTRSSRATVGGEHVAKRRRARFHSLEVAEVRRLTADAVEVTFAVPDELADDYDYLPGQYVALRTRLRRPRAASQLLDLPPARARQHLGRDQARPRRPLLQLGERRARAPATALDVMSPQGTFTSTLDALDGKHIVGIAAGSGITPLMALAHTVLARHPTTARFSSSTRTARRST